MSDEFSAWLESERERRGLTISELAHRAGVSHYTVERIITHPEKSVTRPTCRKLAATLGMPEELVMELAGLSRQQTLGELLDAAVEAHANHDRRRRARSADGIKP